MSSSLRVVPARFQNVLFGFLLSGLMTLIVSAITTLRNLGFDDATVVKWLTAFVSAWPVTFPTVLIVAPIVRRIVARLIVPDLERAVTESSSAGSVS